MRKDITPFNDKGQRHGLWKYHFTDDTLMYKCFYHNGKEIGYEEYSWYSGKLTEKKYYL